MALVMTRVVGVIDIAHAHLPSGFASLLCLCAISHQHNKCAKCEHMQVHDSMM